MPTDPLKTSYDKVAAAYTTQIADELAAKPLDRALLHAFAEQVIVLGPVLDLGCGPGHVAAFIAASDIPVVGMDLSDGMIIQAQQRYPNLSFQVGDMRALQIDNEAFGGISAFYSIIHLSDTELLPTFCEWWRVLRPTGLLLVAFHIGNTTLHLEEWWQQPVNIDFHFRSIEQVATTLTQAGFIIEAQLQREPYPGVEHPSQRAYILARK